MLGFLFRTLTAQPERGAALFDALTAETRRPHWYVEGAVPDTLEGRFAVLATVTALAMIRLERGGDDGNAASVALTERFIQVMETEHRELGLGDPNLGRKVRRLVGSLSRRVELWRSAIAGASEWQQATEDSLYGGRSVPDALGHSAQALRHLWSRLDRSPVDALATGDIG